MYSNFDIYIYVYGSYFDICMYSYFDIYMYSYLVEEIIGLS